MPNKVSSSERMTDENSRETRFVICLPCPAPHIITKSVQHDHIIYKRNPKMKITRLNSSSNLLKYIRTKAFNLKQEILPPKSVRNILQSCRSGSTDKFTDVFVKSCKLSPRETICNTYMRKLMNYPFKIS